MVFLQAALLVSALLCALVAGLVLTFTIIIMPGIRTLGERGYLQAFKAIDRIIQDNQPIFLSVWIGSALCLIGTTLLGLWQLEGLDRVLLILACTVYIAGLHVPTVAINIPINNALQAADLDTLSESEIGEMATLLETRWMRWNTIRTWIAIGTTILLLSLLIRIGG